MSNLVEIKELGKCYGKKKAMNNLSLSLESGRIIGILGPNGSSSAQYCFSQIYNFMKGGTSHGNGRFWHDVPC